MIETIGNVKLNLNYYQGKDLYSDGVIEDKLLQIVKNYNIEQYSEVIAKEKSWPILYHLSEHRANVIEWYPFKEDAAIFEIGAGCGAITRTLAERAKKLVANDLSKKRSLINANRNKDINNLEIYVGNFLEVSKNITEKFDYITLIGVFEYAESYIPGEKPYQKLLDIVNNMLKENGKIIIAIENRLGLKYFAGCREDHVGKYFEGIEGYTSTSGVKTFCKSEWEKFLLDNGYKNYEFYYPYPDYKFPERIYSDHYLPKKGELHNNIRNFDTQRWVVFDETKAYDSLIEAGMFAEFSNSYILAIDKR